MSGFLCCFTMVLGRCEDRHSSRVADQLRGLRARPRTLRSSIPMPISSLWPLSLSRDRQFLRGRVPAPTFLHAFRCPRISENSRPEPLAVEGLDLRAYDIVLSSSHAGQGSAYGPDQFHLC